MQKVLGLLLFCCLLASLKGQEAPPLIEDIDINVCGGHTHPTKDSNNIYDFVEQSACFPGGDSLMLEFIANNLKYPPLASCIKGRVIVRFIVEKDGSLSDIKVVRKLGGGTDEEAIRVVQLMPNWEPAQQNGKTVRQRYTMPVTFRLVD